MGKKTIIQIALLFILLIIIFFFYYKYFFFKEEIVNLTYQNNEVASSDNNLIKNLEYLSTDKNGNKYLINAEYGELSLADQETNIILMTNVNAQIDMFEKDTIYLTSNFAKYDTLNLETNFYKILGANTTSDEVNLTFDIDIAASSCLLFDLDNIPKIPEDIPSEILDVSYKVDLTHIAQEKGAKLKKYPLLQKLKKVIN